ncbi:Cytochrome C oxidase, cbb3-type, subunit III [Gemmobacter aquatilis]|uniref:Cytochrome C oxidase, cbb3-type, subunit III n=1 Tax=Gemmobacter aquatilis TaxID=933059 RepID=A0A1H7Z2H5_9RHOB|nr:c-type cytochrome [Gemmobacter aquatilis]SEM52445.1 Cytochrome C oxidase, cbb3-type, subunit III [Gemmobacter aquatilis]
MTRPLLAFTCSLALVASSVPATATPQTDALARGAYLVRIMACADCHSPRGADGAPMPEKGLSGGSIGFDIPGLGIFWGPNLTPDATGIGAWTDAEVTDALRRGIRPDGRILAPAMPWPAYAALSDDDARAIVAFLRAQPAVAHSVPDPAPDAAHAVAPYFTVAFPE